MNKAQELLEELDELEEVSDEVKAERKAERAEAVKLSKELKKRYEKDWGVKLKSRVIAMVSNPWIEIRVANFGDDVIPNEFRLKAAKHMGATNIRDESDVSYGNVQSNSVSMQFSQWKDFK